MSIINSQFKLRRLTKRLQAKNVKAVEISLVRNYIPIDNYDASEDVIQTVIAGEGTTVVVGQVHDPDFSIEGPDTGRVLARAENKLIIKALQAADFLEQRGIAVTIGGKPLPEIRQELGEGLHRLERR
jgi:hypothetical protein